MDEEFLKLKGLLEEATQKSKCAQCGQEAYGKGCIYNARGIHLHLDDPTRCGWCGSKTTHGAGCIYSPTGFHGIGANLYTSMVAECFITSYLLNKLITPFTETNSFKYGIISEDGVVIKKPKTPEEKKAHTFLDSFIFKVKKYLGNKVNLLQENLFLEASKRVIEEKHSVEDFEKELLLKKSLKRVSKDFHRVISEAEESNIPTPIIEKAIIESFLNDEIRFKEL